MDNKTVFLIACFLVFIMVISTAEIIKLNYPDKTNEKEGTSGLSRITGNAVAGIINNPAEIAAELKAEKKELEEAYREIPQQITLSLILPPSPAPSPSAVWHQKIRKSQSEILNQREEIITNENCTGNPAGTIYWNPYGSMCRHKEAGTATRGLIKPINCCKKFYYSSNCTKNLGIIQRGIVEKSQFFLIGCYN